MTTLRALTFLCAIAWHSVAGAGISLATNTVASVNFTRAQLLARDATKPVVAIGEALASLAPALRIDLDAEWTLQSRNLFFASTTTRVVRFDQFETDATLVQLVSRQDAVRVVLVAFLMKPKGERGTIFLPLATALDGEGKPLGELVPADGSGMRGNTLSSVFDLPPGTRYVLVHTDPGLLDATLSELTAARPDNSFNAVGLGALLGGALGGAIFGLFDMDSQGTQVEKGKVPFAPFGILQVCTEPEWRTADLVPKKSEDPKKH